MSKSKYKLEILGNIATVSISNVDKKTNENEMPVKLCNFTDVYYNWSIHADLQQNLMNATVKKMEIDKFCLKKGQIALTKDSETKDDIGISALIEEDFKNVILGYHCALIKPKQKILVGSYLNAFLHTKFVRKYFELNAGGSGQRYTLPLDIINKTPILLPELRSQKIIGEIFTTLDQKTRINNKINAELEKMAKTLYDYWFVKFDFPNDEGKPYRTSGGAMTYNSALKREIPQNWEVVGIEKLAPITTGKEDANFATNNGKYAFFTCGEQELKCKTAVFSGKALLIAGNGNIDVKFYEGNFNAYQRTYVLIPTNENNFALMYFAIKDKIKALTSNTNGSIIKFITKAHLQNIKVFQGIENSLLEKLNNLLLEILKLNQQNKQLAELRDFLLPLLMTGQVQVVERQEQAFSIENGQEQIKKDNKYIDQRFDMWLETQGLAARGEVDKTTLRAIFDAMDDEDK